MKLGRCIGWDRLVFEFFITVIYYEYKPCAESVSSVILKCISDIDQYVGPHTQYLLLSTAL